MWIVPKGDFLQMSSLKSIIKVVHSTKQQKLSIEEKIFNEVVEYMRDKVEKNHTFIFKWELASLMKMKEVNRNVTTNKQGRTKKEERYYNIIDYISSFQNNGFQIPIMDIVHRLGRYFQQKKKTTKEVIRELTIFLSNVPKDQTTVAKKDVEMIIQQEQSDKRYVAVENFLNSFLEDHDKTVLVMSATPMCHMIEELIPLLNLVVEDKVELDIFQKPNWREILAKKIQVKYRISRGQKWVQISKHHF